MIFEAYVDIDDLPKLLNFGYKWSPLYLKNSNSYYVQCTMYLGVKEKKALYKKIYLHQFIRNNTDNYIDHINHNTLDNRKSNLRISQNNDNTKNRKSKNSNNTSGYRNVFWDKRKEKWVVQLQIDGKNKVLGEFLYDALDKAGELAERMREKYYGEFKGKT